MPAMMIWPWAPMLNRPARKARATPRPAVISGVAMVRVSISGANWPADAGAAGVEHRALEQRDVGAGGGGPDGGEEVGGPGEEVAGRGADLLVRAGDEQAAEDQREQHGQDGHHAAAGEDPAQQRSPVRRGRLPLWAETGTAEGCMAPPAVSSAVRRRRLAPAAPARAVPRGRAGVSGCRSGAGSAAWRGWFFSVMVFSYGAEWDSCTGCAACAGPGPAAGWCLVAVSAWASSGDSPAIISPRTSRPVPAGTMPTSLPL